MIYLHYKDTKTFGHSFSFLLIFKTLRASYLQVGNFSYFIDILPTIHCDQREKAPPSFAANDTSCSPNQRQHS